ncbi:MAG: hypothetical protein EON54_08235 [Alcaligenaceae bacterium]|nr:MAG: hypothetical protein EON54_08235 [Alcaligenaceae bacterium]
MSFVGCSCKFAAAVTGQQGVAHAIDLLRAEVDRTLALLVRHRSRDIESRTPYESETPGTNGCHRSGRSRRVPRARTLV